MINTETRPDAPNIFAFRLRLLRRERQLTQAEMARQIQMPRVTYTHYELGKRTPDLAGILQLARFHQVSVDYLLGNSSLRLTLDDWLRQSGLTPSAEPGVSRYPDIAADAGQLVADRPDAGAEPAQS